MSATFAKKNIGLRAFGKRINVPNNPIARLMHYLDCVATVIDYHDCKFSDFNDYDNLPVDLLETISQVGKILNPQLFIEAGIFIINQNLLFELDNQFYEITDETIGVHVNSEIIVGGKTVKVLKVMACNRRWLTTFYYNPMNAINSLIIQKKNERVNTEASVSTVPIVATDVKYEGEPVTVVCRFCGKVITTRTKSKFNFVACFCFLMFNILYCCIQLCGEKNVLCCDITHTCPKCGAVLGYYKSC